MQYDTTEQTIEQRWAKRKRGPGRVLAGLMLLIIGGLLLLKSMNIVNFPSWFFTWPMILIGFGLFSGLRQGFKGGYWLILLLMGVAFLYNKIDPTLQIGRFIFPVALMAVGLLFIFRPRRHHHWVADHGTTGTAGSQQSATDVQPDDGFGPAYTDRRDFIDVTAVFGGVKKLVLSKQFRGGDIVSFMGGSEIDLSQADFNGRIVIDVTNVMGGTKLIVPPHWDVQSDISAIFGGVDDKRQVSGVHLDPNKVVVLDGTCLFGGLEIRN